MVVSKFKCSNFDRNQVYELQVFALEIGVYMPQPGEKVGAVCEMTIGQFLGLGWSLGVESVVCSTEIFRKGRRKREYLIPGVKRVCSKAGSWSERAIPERSTPNPWSRAMNPCTVGRLLAGDIVGHRLVRRGRSLVAECLLHLHVPQVACASHTRQD